MKGRLDRQEGSRAILTRTRFCHTCFPGARAGLVTCVGIPLRELPSGSLLYEVLLSGSTETLLYELYSACSTSHYSSSTSSTVLALRIILTGRRWQPDRLRRYSSPRTSMYGSLLYEAFLSERNHTVACSTRYYPTSLSFLREAVGALLIFVTWIFLMAPLQSNEAQHHFLVPQKARAQTN